MEELDLKEQLARIDRELAKHDRLCQEIRLAPWALVFGGIGAGATITLALGALMAYVFKLGGPL
jgi:hypothetical protein